MIRSGSRLQHQAPHLLQPTFVGTLLAARAAPLKFRRALVEHVQYWKPASIRNARVKGTERSAFIQQVAWCLFALGWTTPRLDDGVVDLPALPPRTPEARRVDAMLTERAHQIAQGDEGALLRLIAHASPSIARACTELVEAASQALALGGGGKKSTRKSPPKSPCKRRASPSTRKASPKKRSPTRSRR
jgi:hypothetical protein